MGIFSGIFGKKKTAKPKAQTVTLTNTGSKTVQKQLAEIQDQNVLLRIIDDLTSNSDRIYKVVTKDGYKNCGRIPQKITNQIYEKYGLNCWLKLYAYNVYQAGDKLKCDVSFEIILNDE